MPETLFIPDGETRTAYIKPMPNEYPAVRFNYRRSTARSLPELNGVFNERDENQIVSMAEVLCKRIIGLCAVGDDHQNIAPDGDLTAERLLSMSPFLFRRLQQIVTGVAPSDPDPLNGNANGTAETDSKNSKAG